MIKLRPSEPRPITNTFKSEVIIEGKRHKYNTPIIKGSLNLETGVLTVKKD